MNSIKCDFPIHMAQKPFCLSRGGLNTDQQFAMIKSNDICCRGIIQKLIVNPGHLIIIEQCDLNPFQYCDFSHSDLSKHLKRNSPSPSQLLQEFARYLS